MSKVDELLELLKANVAKKEEKKTCPAVWALAIIGGVAAVAAIAYAVYRYFSADKEELEDDFDDDFDDDFFEDEEEEPEQIVIPKCSEEEAVEGELKVEEN